MVHAAATATRWENDTPQNNQERMKKKNISRGKEKELDLRLKSKQTSVETLLLFFRK